jgi:hypothetical protein
MTDNTKAQQHISLKILRIDKSRNCFDKREKNENIIDAAALFVLTGNS